MGTIALDQAELSSARASFRASLELYQGVPARIGVALAIAGLASTLEVGARAAFLAGAAEAVGRDEGSKTWTIEQRELEWVLRELRSRQGETEAWASGRRASLADAVQESLAPRVVRSRLSSERQGTVRVVPLG